MLEYHSRQGKTCVKNFKAVTTSGQKKIRDAGFNKKFKFRPKNGKHIFSGVDKLTGTKAKAIYNYDGKGYYYESTEYIFWKGKYSRHEDIIIKARYDGSEGIFKVEKAEKRRDIENLFPTPLGQMAATTHLMHSNSPTLLIYSQELHRMTLTQ